MQRNNTIQTIQETNLSTHRSYDALKYPLIFLEREDG